MVCTPKTLVGQVRATNQAQGMDLIPEFQRTADFSNEQTTAYEATMASYMREYLPARAAKSDSPKVSAAMKLEKLGFRRKDILRNYLQNPSVILPQKIWSAVDKAFEDWDAGKYGEMNQRNYMRKMAPKFDKLLQDVDSVIVKAKNVGEANRKLAKAGMTLKDAHYARSYLTWLKDGAHLRRGGDPDLIDKGIENIVEANAAWNPKWTIANAHESYRTIGYFANRPDAIARGALDTLVATKGNPFGRVPELAKRGVYDLHTSSGIKPGGNDIFSASVRAQKNFVHHIAKAAGVDPYKATRDLLFEHKPWDMPSSHWNPDSRLKLGWMRYAIGESLYAARTTKNAITGAGLMAKGTATGNAKMAARGARAVNTFLVSTLVKTALTGTVSLIPAPVWQAMPSKAEDVKNPWLSKEFWKGVDNALPVNPLKKMTGIDLSEFSQSFGGALGVTLRALSDTAVTKGLGRTLDAGIFLVEGAPDKMALAAASAGSALWSVMTGAPILYHKVIEGIARSYLGETKDTPLKSVGKKVFGANALPKSEKSSGKKMKPIGATGTGIPKMIGGAL